MVTVAGYPRGSESFEGPGPARSADLIVPTLDLFPLADRPELGCWRAMGLGDGGDFRKTVCPDRSSPGSPTLRNFRRAEEDNLSFIDNANRVAPGTLFLFRLEMNIRIRAARSAGR